MAMGMPEIRSQTTLAMREGAPPPGMTSLPKGARDSFANLKHWRPQGIPTTVRHHSSPEPNHPSAENSPPHNSHRRLPRNVIPYSFRRAAREDRAVSFLSDIIIPRPEGPRKREGRFLTGI